MIKFLNKSKISGILGQMEPLVSAYIAAAKVVPPKTKAVSHVLLKDLLAQQNLDLVHVATSNLPIRADSNYQTSAVTIRSFGRTYVLVGGVNQPKKIECLGSDGKIYRQLVKGKDDLRQDAVMEQVFCLVNSLLQQTSETRKRALSIRTYKVIPLSPKFGLLEWVDNTLPLRDYLVDGHSGIAGAHPRYRPQDWLSSKCRELLKKANNGNKLKLYQEIEKNFRPVLHHFFLETFGQPAEWFERRVAYTRSMACNSIVGCIVELGDRHISNILIDQSTAEVVHIDLGIAFGQGKALPTAEVVPFRLTRDLVDAMGVSGTEGVFRRCCEETLRVLRAHRESLLTIMEVFLHDPLNRWVLSPLKEMQKRNKEQPNIGDPKPASEGNRDAEIVLRRLDQKLQGFESTGVLMSVWTFCFSFRH
jgi:serine-protein kinase ATM